MIKEREIAIVKTTGEKVFVLALEADQARVRRPVVSEGGIRHFEELFFIDELNSIQDHLESEYTEMVEFQKRQSSRMGKDEVLPVEAVVN